MKQGGEHSSGFTIVETLIVLTVSAGLAVSALLFIDGHQSKTQFQTGINDLQQQIQQIINETVSGYYPNNQDFQCTTDASGSQPRIVNRSPGSPRDQGTNDQCIMVGKAFVFRPPNSTVGNNGYLLYTLAGRRTDKKGNDVHDQTTARAVAIARTTDPPNNAYTNDSITETKHYENGITYQWAKYGDNYTGALTDPPNKTLFAVASSFASYSDDALKSQGQSYELVGANQVSSATGWADIGINSTAKIAQMIYGDAIRHGLGTDDGYDQDGPFEQVELCFASGTTEQSGKITIGDADTGGLGVTLQIYDGLLCGRTS